MIKAKGLKAFPVYPSDSKTTLFTAVVGGFFVIPGAN